jgi:hypothetical protein
MLVTGRVRFVVRGANVGRQRADSEMTVLTPMVEATHLDQHWSPT